jgi:serine/threonine protein kinase
MRGSLLSLWRHHLEASDRHFLEGAIEFNVAPVFAPGQLLAERFMIERMLGKGGMGEVYQATDQKLGGVVAVKTISRLLATSVPVRRQFLREVQNARRVSHPNVCRLYDFVEANGIVLFAMEYLDGVPLSQVLNDRRLMREHGREIARQIADGLSAAHGSGIVHGDFKPANVMITGTESMRAVVMDFGLARALAHQDGATATSYSLQAGSTDYMAPELLAGAPPSIASDIFAFGKVAQLLVPGVKLWEQCVRPDSRLRLQSLSPVKAHLGPRSSRRV